MKKILLLSAVALLTLSSCVSKKEFLALEAKQKSTQDLLNTATVKLNKCLADEAASAARLQELKDRVADMKSRVADMKSSNKALIESSKDMTVLTTQGAKNLEKSLESIKRKRIKNLSFTRCSNKKRQCNFSSSYEFKERSWIK